MLNIKHLSRKTFSNNAVLLYERFMQSLRAERIFFIIGSFFGLLIIVITPPLQFPDAVGHLVRTYEISQGSLIVREPYYDIPKSIFELQQNFETPLAFHQERRQDTGDIYKAFSLKLDPSNTEQMNTRLSSIHLYPPVPYLPAAVVMFFGSLLNAPAILILYIANIINMFVCILLTSVAIKITPIYKWLFFILALMPMAVFLRSSISADSLTNTIAFLTVCLFLFHAYGEHPIVTKRDFGYILLVTGALALCKNSYFLLSLLYLLIPVHKCGSYKRYWLYFGIQMILVLILSLGWSALVSPSLKALDLQSYVSVEDQQKFVIAHPFEFLFVIINSTRIEWVQYTQSFIGILGYYDTLLPMWIYILQGTIVICILIIGSSSKVQMKLKDRALLLFVFASSIVLVFLPIYLVWVAPGGSFVPGIQGRYFIAVLPVFLLTFYHHSFFTDTNIKYMYRISVSALSTLSLIIVVQTLIDRYHTPINYLRQTSLSAPIPSNKIVLDQDLIQSITCPVNELNNFSLLFATYNNKNTSALTIRLTDNKEVVVNETLNTSTLQDNAWHTVILSKPFKECRGKNLLLTLHSDDNLLNNAVSLWTFEDYYPGKIVVPTASALQGRDVGLELNTYNLH